ncbi:hypothetical protein FPOAC2_07637 [Fusarium poae]|jgi:hypothetical protein
MDGQLREICIFELIKMSWHQPFNHYAWVVERDVQGNDMAYHSNDTVRLGHMFSLVAKLLLSGEDDKDFWIGNIGFVVEAYRQMMEK